MKNSFPNLENFQYGYDSSGRLNRVAINRGDFSYGYDSFSGQLISARSPENSLLNYDWDGPLLKSMTWAGQISGAMTMSCGDQMRLSSETIQNTVEIPYRYTMEGSLKSAGPLALSYNSSNGLLTDGALYSSNEGFAYSAFGGLATRSVTLDSTTLYNDA